MKNVLLIFLALLIFSLAVFYFWGSNSHYPSSKYNEIKVYHNDYKSEGDTLKIMTYNIGYLSGMTNNMAVGRNEELFKTNLDRSIDLLSTHQPDIIGFQEIDFGSKRSYYHNQLDSIGINLNYPNSSVAVNWDKSYVPFPYWPIKHHFGKMLSGQAVLSKMQIVSNEFVVLQKPINAPFYYNQFYLERLIQISKILVKGNTVILMNVHLEAFDLETRQLHAAHLLSVFEEYAKEFPVLLIGDFNAIPSFVTSSGETETTMSIFIDHPLLDMAISEEQYRQEEEQYFTFDSVEPTKKIDYIFFTKNSIEKIASGVAREAADISDHLPVWMSFRLR